MRNILCVTTAAILCGLATAPAQAQSFDSVVAFGDSLSDGGNLADLLHLPHARFTTNPGLTTVENIAGAYGLTLTASRLGGDNYAYGGAGFFVGGVPTLTAQANTYLAAHAEISPDTLFFVWGGANDVFAHGNQTPAAAEADLRAAAQAEGDLLDALQSAGARNIIVANLPDIGLTVTGTPDDTAMVDIYNAELNAQLDGRTGIIPVNAYALIREIAANPAQFGYTNVSSRACTVASSLLCTPNTLVEPNADQTYLFADDVHPTSAAHAALAQVVVSEISAPGQMSMLSLAPLALLRGHRAAAHDALQTSDVSGARFFFDASVGERSFDGDAAVADSESDDTRFTFGGVWRTSRSLALGAALSYGQSDMEIGAGAAAVEADTLFVSAFAQTAWSSGAWAGAQIGYGATDYNDIERRLSYGGATRTETSDSSGDAISAELAAGRRFEMSGLNIGPFASLAYERIEVDAFAETSGDATAMRFAAQERDSTTARLGLELGGDSAWGAVTLQPIARVAYAHDFSAEAGTVRAGLTTMNGEFDMPGFSSPDDWVEASLGLGLAFANGVVARLSYEGAWSDAVEESAAAARVWLHF